jgi:hypothetical protein
MYPTSRDVLSKNSTLKNIVLDETPFSSMGKDVAIMEQLQRYATSKELHVKQMEVAEELDMAKATSTKVALCS